MKVAYRHDRRHFSTLLSSLSRGAVLVGLLLTTSLAFAQFDDGKDLCVSTGGEWEETSCGDYFCGQPPLCLALIPGCNCGPGKNFDGKEGCLKDAACPAPGSCTTNWDCAPCGSCKDGKCVEEDGNPPECVIDEDCGENGVCITEICPVKCVYIDPPPPTKEEICTSTGGNWKPNSCGDYTCGIPPLCEAIIPGCDCGPNMNMTAQGCEKDVMCSGPEPECETDEDCEGCFGFCGGGTCYYTGLIECETDAQCAEGFTCDECGQCAEKDDPEGGESTEGGEPTSAKEYCTETGGKWEPYACGDYVCGVPNPCEAIDPGCNCGPAKNMTPTGCEIDDACVATPPECSTDEDCVEGCDGICSNGSCLYVATEGCKSDEECPDGFSCGECGDCVEKENPEGGEGTEGGDTGDEEGGDTGDEEFECSEDSFCDDGNQCNGAEACIEGFCEQGTLLNCDDGNACTIDGCEPGTGCINEPFDCDDNDPCTADSCDVMTGDCINEPGACDEVEGGSEGDGLMEEIAKLQAECEAQGLEFSMSVTSCTPLTCEEALADDETRAGFDQCETEFPGEGCVCPEDTPVTHPELGCITVAECEDSGETGEIETVGDEEGSGSPNIGVTAEDGCMSSTHSKPVSMVIIFSFIALLGLRIRNSRRVS